MSFKSYLLDVGGEIVSSALKGFVNALENNDSTANSETEAIIQEEKDYHFEGPKLILNRKVFKCPECGNENDNYLYHNNGTIECFLCNNKFQIASTDYFADPPTLIINNRPVHCPDCWSNDARTLQYNHDTVLCKKCKRSFRIKFVFYPDEGELLDS